MAATHRIGARLAAQGIEALIPARGLAALGQVLERPVAQIGVLPIDWPKFLSSIPAGEIPPFVRGFSQEAISASTQRPELLRQLEQAPSDERLALMVQHIRDQIAKVLGHTSSQSLDSDQSLMELGLDSLMVVELKNWVEKSLEVDVPLPFFLEDPSVSHVAMQVLERLDTTAASRGPEEEPAAAAKHSQEAGELLQNFDQLSDAEVDALLNTMLVKQRHRS